MSALTYEEFMELARQNYTRGGEVFYECWEKYQFQEYVKQFGEVTVKQAMKMFKRGY